MKFWSKIQLFFLIGILLGVFVACDPEDPLPSETYLEYRGYYALSSDTIVLNYYFEDGDGNVGMASDEEGTKLDSVTGDTIKYNFYVYIYDSVTGVGFEPMLTIDAIDPKPVYFGYKIPNMTTGSIRATMQLRIHTTNLEFMRVKSQNGIVFFEAFIYDWDYVKSNVVLTDKIRIRE